MNKFISKSLFFILITVLFTACNVSKFISDDEFLLTNYEINVNGPLAAREETKLANEIYYLDTLQQIEKQNWKVWVHYKYGTADSGTIKNFIYRRVGSRPNIYKEGEGLHIKDQISRYLMDKGYYDADTYFSEKLKNKKATIIYDISTGPLYEINNKTIIYPSEEIETLIKKYDHQSFLKKGDVLSAAAYEKEKARIVKIMQDNGYPYFSSLNISKRPDAIKNINEIDIRFEIQDDADSVAMRKFYFGEIVVNHDHIPFAFQQVVDTATIDNIQHLNFDAGKSLDRLTMNSIIPCRPGEVFSRSKLEQARSEILRYNVYSSVIIQEIPSPENPDRLNIYLILTPSLKYEFNSNFDFNNTTYSSRSLIGASLGPEITNRNFLGKGENFTTGLELLSEFNPWDKDRNVFQTFIFGIHNNLTIQKFVDYFHSYSLLKKPFPTLHNTLKENGLSSVNVNYDYVLIDSFYTYHSLNFSLGNNFNWGAGRNNLRVNNLGINVFLPDLAKSFEEQIADQEFVRKSLDPQIFTGLFFNSALFTHVSLKDYAKRQYTFNGTFEVSGLEVMLANYAINQLRDTFQLFDKFEFAKFVKLDLDGRFSKDFTPSTSFASRINVGIAIPLPGAESIPFTKQFYLGGPSSMRAWKIRELGPGSSTNESTLDPDFNQPYAQVGDFKLEMNAEYRFPLFWRLNSAIFMDVGNIWSLGNSDSPNALLTNHFWKELAVGTGTGLRIDMTFFILRLDWGIKLKLPYQRENGSYWAFSKFGQYFTESNLNLAISMPF